MPWQATNLASSAGVCTSPFVKAIIADILPASQKDYLLHEVLLSGWGMPIGELFALEDLAEQCKKSGRFSFFVCSEVCNVPGGVASPPNILAIF